MKDNSLALITVIAILANLAGAGLVPLPAAAAPARASLGALPSWFVPASAATNEPEAALPAWFFSADPHLASSALPTRFSPANRRPGSGNQNPVFSPPPRQLLTDIPQSLLTVDVIGPNVASLDAPIGAGEVYTAVIRNSSTITAYGVYITATHRTFMIHDGGDELISSTGDISFTVVTATSAITWTPVTTYNLLPGEAITLNFKLRATCSAESGKRLEVGVRYNADPPPADPVELNFAGLNVTTGRGNLVITKEPALQHLGTPDFGKPITWTITVQNTGLGKLYNAVITDSGGIDLDPPTLTPPTTTIPVLDVNETRVFTAVGTVEACNFTNVALASWPCGNKVGDATASNPLSSTVSVLFTPELPNVNVQAFSPITCPYCDPVTRTVAVTIDNAGGPAGNFRLDSGFESDGFWEMITPSLSSDWVYAASSGLFSYTGGSPTGTIPAAGQGVPVTLTFQIHPSSPPICEGGGGTVAFEPLYNDICSNEPFAGNPTSLVYQYAQGEEPILAIAKSGPSIVSSGEVFTYQVTVSGENADHISGTVNVTDVLPSEFELLGIVVTSTGVAQTNNQTVTWSFDPSAAVAFSETLIYQVRVVTTTSGVCGASQIVANRAEASANPTCPGCPALTAEAQVNTAIENNEGIFPDNSTSGVYEACGDGFVIANSYLITGSAVVTWTGAVFTEALGTDIGGAGPLPGSVPLIYRAGSLSVTVDGVDYTSVVIPVTSSDHLVIDLTPLQAAGALTQNLTLMITYTVEISEGSLGGAVEQTFHDWTQLFLPDFRDDICAGNNSFNQVLVLTIGRGDLGVGLSPQILEKCRTNRATIHVNGGDPDRLTDHIVVTFTSSTTEVLSARNFATTGGMPDISQITVMTDADIGGGRGIITFTLPITADLASDGTIQFDVDVNCTDEAPWNAGITFQSRCAFTYGDAASLGHIYRKPNLLLFATPIKYTVREKEVLWKFFVTNNGNLTATDVVVTNAVQGLAVFTYTTDGPGISANLPITNADAVFTVTQIAPNQQRAVTVTARVIQCDPLHVAISATHRCFGTVCNQPTAEVSFDTPDPYLLTNNGETADLPMCDPGKIIFTTKNASPDVTLYQLNITETLRGLRPAAGEPITVTIEDADENVVAWTTAFTPTEIVSGTYPNMETLLIWKAISATTDVYTWFNALPPLYVVRIFVPVNTSCVPPNVPQSWAAADAQGPCGKKLGYTEDAVTLQINQPDMDVVKEGKVAGGEYGDEIYATLGQTITWRLQVYNYPSSRSYVAHNVVLSDTWPANFEFITATTAYPFTIITSTRTITWDIGDMAPDNDPVEFFITGTLPVTDSGCLTSTINRTQLRYGCDFDGCENGTKPMDTAQVVTIPELEVILSPEPLPVCEGDIPVTVRNYGARAFSNTLTVTLPSGYVYSETVGADLPPSQTITTDLSAPVFKWDVIPGRTSSAPYEFTLTMTVRNVGGSGACPVADGGPVTATMQYDNHPICADPGPWVSSDVVSLDVLTPSLTVAKTPRTQTAGVNDLVTWTIAVTNSGRGIAENVVITDVVEDSYHGVTATIGSDGSVPNVAGNEIAWILPAPIAALTGVWTATVTAVLSDTGLNRNVVTATAYCAVGCETAVVTGTAYTSLLQGFEKSPDIQTGTIGSLAVFTFTTILLDTDALYQDLTLTDTLPAGLGYVSSVLAYTYDGPPGTPAISNTPTITPGWLDSGHVVWRLGDQPGTVQINGVVTAVIQNISSNQDGVRRTNTLRMTYTDNGQFYEYQDTADVDVLEPNLVLDKRVASSTGRLTGLDGSACLTYTLIITSDGNWPAYDVSITDALPSGISVTAIYGGDSNSGPAANPLTWTFGVIPTDTVVVVSYTARINDALPGVTLTNVATVTWTSTPDDPVGEERDGSGGVNDYVDGDDASVGTAQLALDKATEPYTLRVGDIVTYHLVFTVPAGTVGMGGNSYLVDALPPGVQYITGSEALDWTPPAVSVATTTRAVDFGNPGQIITWTFGTPITSTQDAPTVVTLTFQAQATGVRVDNGTLVWLDQTVIYPLTNTVTLWQRDEFVDDDQVNNEVIQPSLSIAKDSTPPSGAYVGAGDIITYTLTTTNDGIAPAYDVLITDLLPPGVDYVRTISAPNPSTALITLVVSGQQITYTVSELAAGPGATMLITVVARVSDTIGTNLMLTNTAAIPYYDSQPGDGPGPCTPTQRIYSDGSDDVWHRTPDGAIAKSVTPLTATLGDVITYVLAVPASPITATFYSVTVNDELDGRLMLQSVSGPGGTVTTADNVFTVTYPSILAGEQRTITITAVLSSPLGADAGDVITNVAILSHTAGITVSNQPVFTVTEPSLSILKASDPPTSNTVEAGDSVTYTARITNSSGSTVSPAYDVAFTDTLPVGMRDGAPILVAVTLNGTPVSAYTTGYDAGVLTVTFTPAFSIPAGGVLLVQYVATVDADVGTGLHLTNRAEVAWSSLPGDVPGDRDYGPINDTTTVHTPLATGLSKGVQPATATIGSQVVFTVALPAPRVGAVLDNVVFTDIVDSRLRIDGVSLNASYSGQVVTAFFSSIPTYTQEIIVITATVRDLITVTNGARITNVATLDYTANPSDTIESNVVTVTVEEPSVTLDKSVQTPRDPLGAGDLVTYTLALANTGTWPAYDLVISDSLPAGLTFVATQDITVTDPLTATLGGSYLAWTVSQLNVGGHVYVTFTAQVAWDIGAGLTLTNTAWGAYDGQPGEPDDERDYPILTDTVPIETGWPALDLEKTAEPGLVEAGSYLTYTLTVINTGLVSATGVVITDVVPINTTFVAATLPHTGPDASDVITWALGTLDVGVGRSVTMVVQVDSDLPAGSLITNTAWVTSGGGLTDTNEVIVPVGVVADLVVVKTDTPDPVVVGTLLTYTLVVTNDGPSDAEGVVLTDTLPPQVSFVGADPSQDGGPNPLVWNLGTMAPGEARRFTVTVQVQSWVTRAFTNSVVVGSGTPDDNPGNNDDEESTEPLVPDMEVVKTVAPGAAARNMPFTYTIRIVNTGQVTFTAISLTDTLPPDFYYVRNTGVPADPDTIAEPLLVWDDLVPLVGELPPGESLTVTFAVTCTPGITGTYWNVVTATVTTPPGDVLTDTDDAPVTIADPAVEINKEIVGIDRDEVQPNYVTFTIVITNVGPSPIDELPLLDQYDPYYLSFHDGTPYPEQDEDDGTLTWENLTGPAPHGFDRNLAPGESFLVTTVFRVAHDINVTTTNVATVTGAIDAYDNPANEDDDEEEIGGVGEEDGIPTPVEVLYFRAVAEELAVRLEWATAAELGIAGFHVYRAPSANLGDAQPIGYVPATGPDSTYTYLDRDVTPGQTYWYWLVEEVSAGDPDTYGPVWGGVGIDSLPYRLYLPLVLSNAEGLVLNPVEGLIQKGWGEQPATSFDGAQDGLLPRWAGPQVGLLARSRRRLR